MGQREDLIQIFTTESRENIELLDQGIVRLETEPDNRALLDEIFRAFHTLKGNSGIVGMPRFEKIAHITEEVLTEIRDGKRKINSEVITFLLDSLDQLKILHKAIEETGTDATEIQVLPDPPKEKKSKSKKSSKKASPKKQTAAGKKKSKKAPQEELTEDGSWGIFIENVAADKKSRANAAEQTSSGTDSENPEQEEQTETSGVSRPNTLAASSKQGSSQAEVAEQWSKEADSTIRVDVSLLDSLMNMVGELVLSRNQIMQFATQIENATFHAASQRLTCAPASYKKA